MLTVNSKSNSLETLVRIALLNSELAPGVAKQISVYRSEQSNKLDEQEKRLLAILDDAIADNCITIIQPIHSPALQLTETPPASVEIKQQLIGQLAPDQKMHNR